MDVKFLTVSVMRNDRMVVLFVVMNRLCLVR